MLKNVTADRKNVISLRPHTNAHANIPYLKNFSMNKVHVEQLPIENIFGSKSFVFSSSDLVKLLKAMKCEVLKHV